MYFLRAIESGALLSIQPESRGLLPSDLDLKMTYTFKRGIKISTVVIYDPIQRCIYIWHKYNYINLNLIVGP